MDINQWLLNLDTAHADPRIHAVLSAADPGVWEIRESVALHCEIVQVVQGHVSYRINGMHYIVAAGEMLVIPAGSLRGAGSEPSVPTACHVICAHFPDAGGDEIRLPAPAMARTGLDETLLRLYSELDLEWARRIPGFMLKCRALLLLILHRYVTLLIHRQAGGVLDPRVKEAIAYIVRHYSQPLRLSDLAARAGLNPVYFGALFKNSVGLSAKAYINHVRINNAETLIAGGVAIEEAARRTGFDDVFYFSKVYKRLRGYPPSHTRSRQSLSSTDTPEEPL